MQSVEGDEVGSLGELEFGPKRPDAESELGFRSEKPEAWPSDGPDCETNHLASYGVLNSMDLVRPTSLASVLVSWFQCLMSTRGEISKNQ